MLPTDRRQRQQQLEQQQQEACWTLLRFSVNSISITFEQGERWKQKLHMTCKSTKHEPCKMSKLTIQVTERYACHENTTANILFADQAGALNAQIWPQNESDVAKTNQTLTYQIGALPLLQRYHTL